eukprot:14312347-Alexandrium_andersonii.AAC.1
MAASSSSCEERNFEEWMAAHLSMQSTRLRLAGMRGIQPPPGLEQFVRDGDRELGPHYLASTPGKTKEKEPNLLPQWLMPAPGLEMPLPPGIEK